MSITQGVTGGGSWSGSHTLRWNRSQLGIGYTPQGRPNLNLVGFATNRQIAEAMIATTILIALSATFWPARIVKIVANPLFWAAVNLYEEGKDVAAWFRGEDMSWQLTHKWRPIFGPHPMFGPAVFPVPFPYLDFTTSPSSGGGGPGELPNLHQPPPSIEETGEILSNPSIMGEVPSSPRRSTSKKAGKRRKSCPPGYRWNGRRCVKKG